MGVVTLHLSNRSATRSKSVIERPASTRPTWAPMSVVRSTHWFSQAATTVLISSRSRSSRGRRRTPAPRRGHGWRTFATCASGPSPAAAEHIPDPVSSLAPPSALPAPPRNRPPRLLRRLNRSDRLPGDGSLARSPIIAAEMCDRLGVSGARTSPLPAEPRHCCAADKAAPGARSRLGRPRFLLGYFRCEFWTPSGAIHESTRDGQTRDGCELVSIGVGGAASLSALGCIDYRRNRCPAREVEQAEYPVSEKTGGTNWRRQSVRQNLGG